ncbi:MAG: hypothetical protein A3E02_02405 [Candidatus Zambryskibacteria bacterium RIFCSPHIGHO2_12_FULL_38_34]|uniref:tRNA pseudouridine(55) synthase n=1 Tax=Candidatus Zambryskibacteria bacterium RIFCSPLOWO2_12_FULL_39_16 TaxID=1802775 RepID=A0A1G2URG4_9BACT|nr:MAG: hypothetical protein A3D37_00280 [Candidatus Zambryskibacteria bacterium RIFCSPHIGHO2_02_FULL_38_22]OHA97864.1 MAG: hypothetical protein A3E02_02405 [Candidatus Zambryskibacteria bacterium RIFCSPHIGHO2_12_FULL_38_34]OHB11949.1 MAG: hypothetical protein A3G46_01815 [Candidatus Zambryskibacteria bacterium RIFCSPLOWO2_12_FULL_39_16]
MIHNLYKQRGETPLECIQRFVANNPDLKGQKMTYLGRLDPLAEGVLLIASGDDVKRKEEFLELDKEYDFISLFGFTTDTYDVLGKIIRVERLEELLENDVRKVVMIYEGEREQKYPKYSSKMIANKRTSPLTPLLDAREGEHISFINNSSISLPSPASRGRAGDEVKVEGISSKTKKITVHKIQFHKLETFNNKELFGRLLMDISKVKGDFRQHEILVLWKQYLFGSELGGSYFLGKFSTHVSSGTYIRGLVNDMGNTLGCGATTLSIKRNRVGDYKVEDSIK